MRAHSLNDQTSDFGLAYCHSIAGDLQLETNLKHHGLRAWHQLVAALESVPLCQCSELAGRKNEMKTLHL
jgi:hypothetical protein